ncbi:MAG TPA: PQQ-dependent sugar dehydrogenase [Saprospiraceae bacterium]|nr:PQQ-dependent sugar dehydrogenase [Saprospiraceae bacterium]
MKTHVSIIFFICLMSFGQISAQDTTIVLSTVINSNLAAPIQLTHACDGTNRIFVAEKGGRIKVFTKDYILNDTLITIMNMGNQNEQGLLSVVFHPDFKNNGYFFVFHTQENTNALIVDRYTISASDPDKADVATRLPILNIPHTYSNHNGGEMHFGKDGYLYISTGDGGSGDDPDDNGQDSLSLLGKILRININSTSGGNNYSIPSDNPNNTSPVYCYGLRNPFRWSFDRYKGDMYIGDVGQSAREEINFRPADSIVGSNFGWDCYEGSLLHPTAAPCLPSSNYIFPIYQYQINSTNRSVVGGNVYRGYAYPDLKGWYFAADYFSRNLRKIIKVGSSWVTVNQQMPSDFTGIVDFGETEDGELHIIDITTNRIYKMTTANPKTVHIFTGDGDWMIASNWKSGSVPPNPLPSGSVIVIKPCNNGTCKLSQDRTVSPGGDFIVEPGCHFKLEGPANLILD